MSLVKNTHPQKINILFSAVLAVSMLLLSGCSGGGGASTNASTDSTDDTQADDQTESEDQSADESEDGTEDETETVPEPEVIAKEVAISLSWNEPELRIDGQFLRAEELLGYVIRYTAENSDEVGVINIWDPNITSYEFEKLPPDTYSFTLSTIDIYGLESDSSVPAIKTITTELAAEEQVPITAYESIVTELNTVLDLLTAIREGVSVGSGDEIITIVAE